jgi:beta-glucosidase
VFGYGLSYTSYQYEHIRLDQIQIALDDSCTVSVEVMNIGDVAGHEVVQLYIKDCISTITRPERELKGFQKIYIEPGEMRRVQFHITHRELQFVGSDLQWMVEPGKFEVMIGSNVSNTISTSLEVVPRNLS